MHPRDKVRAHLPASQRKEGLGECHLGPDGHPSRCVLGRSSAYSTLILSIYAYGGNRPPQAIKGDLPHPSFDTPHKRRNIELHCKGEALPRLVLRVAGG